MCRGELSAAMPMFVGADDAQTFTLVTGHHQHSVQPPHRAKSNKLARASKAGRSGRCAAGQRQLYTCLKSAGFL